MRRHIMRHLPHTGPEPCPVNACRRREVLLKSVNVGVLAALFNIGAAARPDGLGIQVQHWRPLPVPLYILLVMQFRSILHVHRCTRFDTIV